jgi:hypothetical protein
LAFNVQRLPFNGVWRLAKEVVSGWLSVVSVFSFAGYLFLAVERFSKILGVSRWQLTTDY